MALQRVQMLLEPRQRQKLVQLAQEQGKSVAEITRQAIDAGLEKISQDEQKEGLIAVLDAARQLRQSMPALDLDVTADIHQMRAERNDGFSNSD